MSRWYEALKEADGYSRRAKGAGGAVESWGLDLPPVQENPNQSRHETPVGEGAQAVAHEAVPHLRAEEKHVSAETLPGTPAHAALDRKARLIPHAVHSGVVEHYRRLRTKIIQQQEKEPFRSLVVTSASPQEGKTVTVLNLALSFATLPSFKVLVIDGDMRRGTLGSWMGVDDNQPGLSNVIDGSAKLEDVVLTSDQMPMHFMVRGTAQVHELQTSDLASHFQRLTEAFDLVLVDSPPVNLIADVQLLAASCDAVLMIARAFSTTRRAFEKAVQELAPFRLIGAVLNGGVAQKSRRYYGYY